ncbi:GWxTD domain-containing protein [Rhodohalobacter sp. 614A]|uniref:GWxTD domain-containing protein n=1 Tax=Rhodohalobacter sp. 614A TaxID=2908649 RepID=UPI001F41E2A8|nr:GWxTD domain-containing protein [Rhodohalobacter sp. 614A]
MKTKFKTASLLIILLFTGYATGCVRSSNPDVERGSTFRFQDGYPEVRMSSIGLLSEDDQALVDITTDIVLGSLIYSTKDSVRSAQVSLEIRILEKEGEFTKTVRRDFSVEADFAAGYQSQEVFTHQESIEVEPGDYDVTVTVLDQSSGKATSRSSEAEIPDPENPQINLTTVRLLGKPNAENIRATPQYTPITTYTVSAGLDSLKFMFQVTNNDMEDPLEIRSRLLKYEADTSVARPMNYNNYSPSTLPYVGVEMRGPEEIDFITRRLDQPGSVLIEFKYAMLEKGTYRFEVETTDENGDEVYKARDFSIKSEHYPTVQTPQELARPLIYLMDRGEHEEMMEIQDSDSLKAAIDRFWLSHIGNMNKAKSVISLYYERVEQANKQFTNFKEGWKTDLGMIYILFGPPWYVDRYLNTMVWSYSYDRTDPRYNYTFERPQMKNEFFPFDNYLLQRNQGYFNIQYRQIQLWLSGNILTTRI